MLVLVLSNNFFLRTGIDAIMDGEESELKRCYLDLSSFKTLREIREALILSVDDQYEIVLLASMGICSRLFSSLHCYNLFSPIQNFETTFSYSYDFLLDFLDSHITLKKLTIRQQDITRVLINVQTIRKAALLLNVNEKDLYRHTGDVASKMNFRSGRDLVNNIHVLI